MSQESDQAHPSGFGSVFPISASLRTRRESHTFSGFTRAEEMGGYLPETPAGPARLGSAPPTRARVVVQRGTHTPLPLQEEEQDDDFPVTVPTNLFGAEGVQTGRALSPLGSSSSDHTPVDAPDPALPPLGPPPVVIPPPVNPSVDNPPPENNLPPNNPPPGPPPGGPPGHGGGGGNGGGGGGPPPGPPPGGPPAGIPPAGPPAPPTTDDLLRALLMHLAQPPVAPVVNVQMPAAGAQAPRAPAEERTKVSDPETFDGSKPETLRDFLIACGLVFADRPVTYRDDNKKVNFAISYLRGTARDYFAPDLAYTALRPPAWVHDYQRFVHELVGNFGVYDEIGKAEQALNSLTMSSSEEITRYIVEFNRHAVTIGWGDAALRYRFYQGLPSRLKDDLARETRPDNLIALKDRARELDQRYHTRKRERDEADRARGVTTKNAAPASGSSSGSSNQNRNNNSGRANTAAATPAASTTPATKAAPPRDNKLGKDGKLTLAEKARRMASDLCLYCRGPGHKSLTCPKRLAAAVARAAGLAPAVPAAPAAPAAPGN